jgi:hypothetical protein
VELEVLLEPRLLDGGGVIDVQPAQPLGRDLLDVGGAGLRLVGRDETAAGDPARYPDEESKKNAPKAGMLDDLKAMLTNSQWLIVTLAMFVIQIRGGLQGNVRCVEVPLSWRLSFISHFHGVRSIGVLAGGPSTG